MKGTVVPQPVKDLIIDRVKKGERVDDLALEFSLYPNTIRRWLRQSSGEVGKAREMKESEQDSGCSPNPKRSKAYPSVNLQISKLQREKQQLLEIIGELTVLTQQSKKKSGQSLFG